jgi:hypothetical protein
MKSVSPSTGRKSTVVPKTRRKKAPQAARHHTEQRDGEADDDHVLGVLQRSPEDAVDLCERDGGLIASPMVLARLRQVGGHVGLLRRWACTTNLTGYTGMALAAIPSMRQSGPITVPLATVAAGEGYNADGGASDRRDSLTMP